eukprot:Colp12_sorted_trinity150504_noHs@24823
MMLAKITSSVSSLRGHAHRVPLRPLWCQYSTQNATETKGLRVLFFGSCNFAVRHLEALQQRLGSEVRNLGVVVPPDKLKKHKLTAVPVKDFAIKHGLPVLEIPVEGIKSWTLPSQEWDLGVVVSFGYLIPKEIIEGFPKKMINVHPSLLPRWRGAAPIHHTILAGDSETGVTVLQLSIGKFDKGNILYQERVPVDVTETTTTLSTRLADMGANSLIKTLQNYSGYLNAARPQASEGATLASKVFKEQGYLDFAKHSATEIDRKHRTFVDMFGVRAKWKDLEVRFRQLHPLSSAPETAPADALPGHTVFDTRKKELAIRCAEGWIGVQSLQMATARNPMTAADFNRGYLAKDPATSFTSMPLP